MKHDDKKPDTTFHLSADDEYHYSQRVQDGDIEPMKQFYCLDTVHPSQMEYMKVQMKETLFGLADGSIPNTTDYTVDELYEYCKSLVAGQNLDHPQLRHGSWTLTSDISTMPFDARVWYIQHPTYIAVSTLSRVLLDFPEIALKIETYFRSMQRGFFFSALRGLRGHGYDTTDEMLEAFDFVCKGGVPKVLNEYPIVAHPRLKEILEEIVDSMKSDLEKHNTKGVWGGDVDYKERYESALKAYADAIK